MTLEPSPVFMNNIQFAKGAIIYLLKVKTFQKKAHGTVLWARSQPLANFRITPILIPVSLEACLIDTPLFSILRSAVALLFLSSS